VITVLSAAAHNRRRRSSVAAFSPVSIVGLLLWLKADAGLYDATSGGSLVTSDGAAVARWEDQSGSGNHATQATSGNRPVLKTAIVNGLPVIRFVSASSQYLTAPDIAGLDNAAAFTLFVVAKRTSVSSFVHVGKRLNGSTGTLQNWHSDGLIYSIVASFGHNAGTFANNDTSFHQVVTRFNGAGSGNSGRLTVRQDRVDKTLTFAGTIPTTTANCGNFEIGRETVFSGQSNCDIAEIILYNSALSDTNRGLVEQYILGRQGV
jgi:hypothetical protein